MSAQASFTALGLVLLKSSLLVALGWCASRALHRASAAARHLVWLTIIAGVLALPVLGELTPLPFRILPAEAPSPAVVAPTGVIAIRSISTTVAAIDGVGELPTPSAAPTRDLRSVGRALFANLDSARLVAIAWAVIAFALTLRLFAGMFAVSRLARRAMLLTTPAWTRVLRDACGRLDVRVVPKLVMSDQVEMAFTFRAASPTIVLPVSANEWSEDRRRAVLLHELAHIQRRDLLGHALAGFACALNWFNPFVWSAARQLRVESEMASDEVVLRAGVRPSVYAQHLLDMVTSFGRRTPSVGLAMARPKEFEGRLVAILDADHRRTPRRRYRQSAVAALVALPTIAIGAITPVPKLRQTVPSSFANAPVPTLHDSSITEPKRIATTLVPVATPSVRSSVEARATLSRDAVATLRRFGTSGVINPMMMLLSTADSLQLSGAQADSIATINRRYMIRLSRIWAPTSAYFAARDIATDGLTLPAGFNPTRETIDALIAVVPEVEAVLTREQRSRLSPRIAVYLERPNLEALARVAPDGAFMSLDQVYGIRGRGRGGG